jgi:hypothetical protein
MTKAQQVKATNGTTPAGDPDVYRVTLHERGKTGPSNTPLEVIHVHAFDAPGVVRLVQGYAEIHWPGCDVMITAIELTDIQMLN